MFDAISPSERPPREARRTGDGDLERVSGAVRVALEARDGVPTLRTLDQRSPCRAMLPRIDGRDCAEIVFVNTAGGIAGGDRLDYELALSGAARVTATTQAAEKIYRALDLAARVRTRIEASAGAVVQWLPHETIVFEGGRLHRSTEINVADDSTVLALEWLVLGREARGEIVESGEIVDSWRVRRDGNLVWADALRLTGGIATLAGRPALLAGCRALATMVFAAPDAGDRIEAARAAMDLPGLHAGATSVGGLLVCRLAASSGSTLRSGVVRVLAALQAATEGARGELPRAWQC